MLTYVINTSENRTFDSTMLFELAGYNRIRWMQCSLTEIKKCAEEICEKQNVLGADRFRIAVIIDFYSFDKIRMPYGRRGFSADRGVDISIYMPYLEIYLLDNLTAELEKKDICPSDFEIYYIHNEKSERYEIFDNADLQLRQIMKGNKPVAGDVATDTVPAPYLESSNEQADPALRTEGDICGEGEEEELSITRIDANGESISDKNSEESKAEDGRDPDDYDVELLEKLEEEKKKMPKIDVFRDPQRYSSFRIYCTSNVSLDFDLDNYPYGRNAMTCAEFWEACRHRWSYKTDIRRHYYLTAYGGGASRSALDTLSLSLYLIRMYEREEVILEEGDLEISHLDANILREVLENAWCKVNSAKAVAKRSNMEYYSLDQTPSNVKTLEEEEKVPPAKAIAKERAMLPKDITRTKLSAEGLYKEISAHANRGTGELQKRNCKEFDDIMSGYLRKRDETRESDVEEEFLGLKAAGFLKTTDRCPSKEEYNVCVDKKQKDISVLFEKALAAEYIEVDYSEEKAKADKAIADYKNAKACLKFNLISDIVLLLIALAAVLIPYGVLQLSSFTVSTVPAYILGLNTAVLFVIIFICALLLQILPQMSKMNSAKKTLYNCYLNCCATERYSFSALRRRYERDLVEIEQKRYEIRQLKRIYSANNEKDRNASIHQDMLEKLEDCISSILNNLDVAPVMEFVDSIEDEFDITKPFRARENKIYQIFSLEAIESMFPRKGSD